MTRATQGHGFAARRFVLDCADVVRRTYSAVMRRGAVRRALHAHGRDHQLDKAHSRAYADQAALAVLLRQMERLAACGATLEELLRFPEVLYEQAFALAGPAGRPLDHIDLDEQRLNGEENNYQMLRRVRGLQPTHLLEEADVCSRLATINTERALACRREAMARQAVYA